MAIDKKELNTILANVKTALDLLTAADDTASDLINSRVIDYKAASVISTYFYRALESVKELTEYLEMATNQPGA